MWKPLNDTYLISSNGEVKNVKTNRLLSPYPNSCGYLRIQIHSKPVVLHRLVASLFVPNPNNLPEVNHIDGNRKNNNVDNLEWCTHADNIRHSYKNGKKGGRTKLSVEALLYIKQCLEDNSKTTRELALLYNVAIATIYAVKQGLNSKRLTYL